MEEQMKKVCYNYEEAIVKWNKTCLKMEVNFSFARRKLRLFKKLLVTKSLEILLSVNLKTK